MSTSFSPELRYRCVNDCRMCGCPGHTLRLRYYHTVDIVILEIDGQQQYCFDDTMFETMIKAHKQYAEQHARP